MTKQLENNINDLLKKIRIYELKIARYKEELGYSYRDKKNLSESEQEKMLDLNAGFRYLSERLYLTICYYLENKKLNEYLLQFKKIVGDNINELNDINKFDIDPEIDEIFYSVFFMNVRKFVFPFVNQTISSEIIYLERILESTGKIIYESGKQIKNEAEIYNTVKNYVTTVFTSAKGASSNFIHKFKEYKPDILIPELYTAVEYKYADSGEKLKNTLDSIATDVKGYTRDPNYQNFYAVFYVTDHFYSENEFNEMWKNLDFPDNWKSIYIIASSKGKSKKL